MRDLVLEHLATGATPLEVNVGVPGRDGVALLPEVCCVVMEATDVHACIESANRDALAAALALTPGTPLVNSVNGEEKSLQTVLPMVKEYGAAVIGLTMDHDGIPSDSEVRLAIARKIVEHAAKPAISAEDVVIDPLVLTVGADSKAGWVTLQTIELVRGELGANVNLGASNVTFGLPERQTIDQAFLGLAIGAGASCAITDLMRVGLIAQALGLLRGRDDLAGQYIKHYCRLLALEGE